MPTSVFELPYYSGAFGYATDDRHVLVMPGTRMVADTTVFNITGNRASLTCLGAIAVTEDDAVFLGSPLFSREDATLLVGPDASITTATRNVASVGISATDILVTNEGLIYGAGYGLYLQTGDGAVAGTSSILNTGRILGSTAAIFSTVAFIDTLRIDNAGLIRSTVDAIALSSASGAITLVNTGSIIGDVRLGSGADLFAGRGGTVDGTVFMGGGNDTARPGLEAETLDGGGGTDTLDFRGRAGVQVSLDNSIGGSGATAGDLYLSFENVSGTRGGDTIIGSTAANLLRGEAGADSMLGGSGNDTLLGGLGKDTLNGGANNDVFQWNASTEGGDTVADFTNSAGNDDRLFFAAAGFAGLAPGPLPAGAYIVRADNVAQQADDRFVFRTTDRTLWFDSDGSGAGAATLIATFGGAVVPTAADFTVF